MPAAASLLTQLITRIAALQSAGDGQYPAGLFPCQRRKKEVGYCREDSNGFFTSLTAFTLQELAGRLPPAARAVAAATVARAVATYPRYRSGSGQALYNFYQTQPRNHFPNGYLLRRTRHFALPDDLDSTALVYLSDPRPPQEVAWLKAKLLLHANTVKGWADTGPLAFRQQKIYSIWIGDKMPIELDASTLANVMLWVLRHELPLNEFDQNTLAFIDWVITSGEYRRRPLGVSAYYATAPLIAYSIGRLAAEAPQLAASRAALLRDLPALLARQRRFSDQLLLATTLLRLGGAPPALLAPGWGVAELEKRTQGLYFCIMPLLNYYPLTRWLARWRLSHVNWECPAYSLALVAEYVALGGQ